MVKRPAPHFHMPLSLFELRALIALVEAANDIPSVPEPQKRAGSRIIIRGTRLLHQQGFIS